MAEWLKRANYHREETTIRLSELFEQAVRSPFLLQ